MLGPMQLLLYKTATFGGINDKCADLLQEVRVLYFVLIFVAIGSLTLKSSRYQLAGIRQLKEKGMVVRYALT